MFRERGCVVIIYTYVELTIKKKFGLHEKLDTKADDAAKEFIRKLGRKMLAQGLSGIMSFRVGGREKINME